MNYFFHLLRRLRDRGISPTGFIDAGAHFGETNDIIRAVYPATRIISFEANPNCEPILKQKGIEYLIAFLGKETTEGVPFYINPQDVTSTGCSAFRELSEHFDESHFITVPTYCLDDIVPVEAKLDFLKMDVQGAELVILDGATKLLPTIKWIYLEVSFVPCNDKAPLFIDVLNYLKTRGYRVSDLCDPTWVNNQLIQCNFLFEKELLNGDINGNV
jgi:FkbM family methyltransferase